MKNYTLFLIFAFVGFATPLAACSCAYLLTFCETANADSKILEVEVLQKYAGQAPRTYMDVKILETLHGTTTEEKLTIVSYGTSCDIFFNGFEIGEKLVVNFTELGPANAIANYPTFSFEACSTGYLELLGDQILGNIEPNITSKNYDDFKNSIGACADLTLLNKNPDDLERLIFMFPNPTVDFINISFFTLNPADISLELFQANGQIITSINRLSQNSYPLDLSTLAVGVYFLRIKYGDTSIVKRVVKM